MTVARSCISSMALVRLYTQAFHRPLMKKKKRNEQPSYISWDAVKRNKRSGISFIKKKDEKQTHKLQWNN